MTRDAQGAGPDDSQRPPASTRWSAPDPAAADELLPPFMPGRSRDRPSPQPGEASSPQDAAQDAAQDAPSEWTLPDSSSADTEPDTAPEDGPDTEPEDEAFPFDGPVSWDESFTTEPQDGDIQASAPALPGEEWGDASWAPGAVPIRGASDDIAERLEQVAAKIRAGGADAARSEMASGDRLTALIATLAAGYLEGREG